MKYVAQVMLIFFLAVSASAAESISDLGWMAGKWIGNLGPMELEENWNEPKAGSIQDLVGLRQGENMMMVELIVIEEHEDSLRLRIQQWDPGMEPRESGRQTMKLVNPSENELRFEAVDEGPMKRLTYRRPAETEFEIIVQQGAGAPQTLKLRAPTPSE